MDVGVFGRIISVIFAAEVPVVMVFVAVERATGFNEEMQALISGFKSAI